MVAVALVSVLALAALAVWARLVPAAPWELDLVLAAQLPPGPARVAIDALNWLGELPIWILLVTVTSLAVGWRKGLRAGLIVALTLAADAAAFAIKAVTERARPDTLVTGQFFGPDAYSFPSGHVVRAVALVAVLVWLFAPPGRRLIAALGGALICGTAMGFARVSLGVHWPTDALGGIFLGVLSFCLIALLVARSRRSEPS